MNIEHTTDSLKGRRVFMRFLHESMELDKPLKKEIFLRNIK